MSAESTKISRDMDTHTIQQQAFHTAAANTIFFEAKMNNLNMMYDHAEMMANMHMANQMGYGLGVHRFQPPMMMQQHVGARPLQPKKERKDKNAPKRNWTAYQFYVEEHRQALREKQPDAGFGQLSKIAAAEWRTLSPDAKRRYEIMADNDKLRYQEEMRHYVPPPGTRGFSEGVGKKKTKKNKNAPKGPLSAYFIFTSMIRPTVVFERPDLNLPGVTKEIAQRWRNLSPEDRVPYEEKSKLDKQRYQNEMATYKSGMM